MKPKRACLTCKNKGCIGFCRFPQPPRLVAIGRAN